MFLPAWQIFLTSLRAAGRGTPYTSDTGLDGSTKTKTSSDGRKEEMFYLMTHSTNFIYSYIVSDMIMREETHFRLFMATLFD